MGITELGLRAGLAAGIAVYRTLTPQSGEDVWGWAITTIGTAGMGTLLKGAGKGLKQIMSNIRKRGKSKPCSNGKCGNSAVCFVAGTLVDDGVELVPIESIQVGERVAQYDDQVCSTDPPVNPDSCVVVDLEVEMPNGYADTLQLELMRDAAWLYANVQDGRAWLSLDELGVHDWAHVVGVTACPTIAEGPGCVVTGTYTHLNEDVYTLHFTDSDVELGVTGLHPLYSADRGDWVPVEQLIPGERILAKSIGWVTVEQVEPRAGTFPVFNIEVAGSHEYLVSKDRIRSHNMCPDPKARRRQLDQKFNRSGNLNRDINERGLRYERNRTRSESFTAAGDTIAHGKGITRVGDDLVSRRVQHNVEPADGLHD